jgi:hypothetical protein
MGRLSCEKKREEGVFPGRHGKGVQKVQVIRLFVGGRGRLVCQATGLKINVLILC